MSINKYLPFAIIYFFLNSLGLPFGLTYTAILAPFFYWWIIVCRKKEILLPFVLLVLPFVIIHIEIVGVDTKAYLVSLINLTAVYIFCQASFTFLIRCNDVEKIFRIILVINFALCLIAIPFYFSSYFNLFWIET